MCSRKQFRCQKTLPTYCNGKNCGSRRVLWLEWHLARVLERKWMMGLYCLPLTIRCFLDPHLAMLTCSKSLWMKFFDHCWLFFYALPNSLSAGQTLWCLAYKTTHCFWPLYVLWMWRKQQLTSLYILTQLKHSVREALLLMLNACVSGRVNYLQYFKCCLKIFPKVFAVGTEKIVVSYRGHLDWCSAYIRKFTIVISLSTLDTNMHSLYSCVQCGQDSPPIIITWAKSSSCHWQSS